MHRTGNRIRILVLIAWPGLALPLMAVAERLTGFSSSDTVTIHSAEAWEDEKPDVIHFSGHFELKSSDWHLLADQASLYGKLDNPETAVLTGSPATIRMIADSKGRTSNILGQADRIVYERDTKSLRMEGNASITRDQNTMRGGEIEYQFEQDRIRAGGLDGVHIMIEPED